jgi:2-phosphosulfolactate phosphatase
VAPERDPARRDASPFHRHRGPVWFVGCLAYTGTVKDDNDDHGTGAEAVAGADSPWSQHGYGVRFEWGITGARTLHGACYVIVDVLSFTTSVGVAVAAGTAVYPYQWHDASASTYAQRIGAVLAAKQRSPTAQVPWSLSPAALLRAPSVPALVLPSPNGSAIAAALADRAVVAACLRNATAVARRLTAEGFGTTDRPVVVVAAGERWPDQQLRPALEDLLGAGAVIDALGDGVRRSPEAETARACFTSANDPAELIRTCASGVELIQRGFPDDVAVATEFDVSDSVPVLAPDRHGHDRFVAWPAS